jgi:glycosyltransferase involved in cell wall biosynthesis
MSSALRVSVLVPAYNEAATIGKALDRLAALPFETEIVVVDDGSTDATPAILAARSDVVVLRQPNRGKGAAVRRALARATAEICVIQDADMEYDPADLPALVAPIAEGRADAVYGSRLSRDAPAVRFTLSQLVGNHAVTWLARRLYGCSLSDVETCYKAFRTDVLRSLPLAENRFGIEPEITAWACRSGMRIEEVPISYRARSYEDGKKINWRDGLQAIRVLVVCRVRPWRGPASAPGRRGADRDLSATARN